MFITNKYTLRYTYIYTLRVVRSSVHNWSHNLINTLGSVCATMTVTDKPVIRQHIRMPATARPPAVAVKTGKSKVMGSPSLHADGSAGGGGVTSLVSSSSSRTTAPARSPAVAVATENYTDACDSMTTCGGRDNRKT